MLVLKMALMLKTIFYLKSLPIRNFYKNCNYLGIRLIRGVKMSSFLNSLHLQVFYALKDDIFIRLLTYLKQLPKIYITHFLLTMDDLHAASRKKDHIELAFQSQLGEALLDHRFFYEPILAAHPNTDTLQPFTFLGKTFRLPFWVSSMTGGTAIANTINHNLAKACGEFGFGMGLGSCRSLLNSDEYLKDFAVRKTMGYDVPLFANLGIAQIEKSIAEKKLYQVAELVKKLEADGLIIHINPLQEWLQPEGDLITISPLLTIERFMQETNIPIIVKEVGQGMGKESLRALFQLPLLAVDFAAFGGTNFAQLELLRSDAEKQAIYKTVAQIGHTATEMVNFANELVTELGEKILCKQVIISGGIKNFLDGYYLTEKLNMTAIYGQASAFLKYAQQDYESLQSYVETQKKGLALAKCFLKVKN
jgi:isopentenyl-diphosphate delta-isomerase